MISHSNEHQFKLALEVMTCGRTETLTTKSVPQ